MFGTYDNSEKMNTTGVGLGLVIAQSICKKFDGDIEFKSTPGSGTTFKFKFKLSEDEEMYQANQREIGKVKFLNSD